MTRPTARWAALALGLLLVGGCGGGSRGSAGPAPAAAEPSAPTAAVRTPETGPGERPARALAAFASGGAGDRVPWADRVVVQVGDSVVREVGRGAAARPATWRGCPADEATYEGRDCPVSVLRPLADLHRAGVAPVVEQAWPRTVGCSRVASSRLPEAGTAVVLRPPPQRRDCFSDFAVMLRVDDAGRVSGVALALSGP